MPGIISNDQVNVWFTLMLQQIPWRILQRLHPGVKGVKCTQVQRLHPAAPAPRRQGPKE